VKAYAETNAPSAQERNQLIAAHLDVARRIALRVARKCPSWISVDDLLAAGLLGLTEAAERYDASRGEPFIAFAEKRIRGAALDELRRGDFMPRGMRDRAKKVGAAIRRLETALGREPSDDEVAAELGVSVEEYREKLEILVHASLCSLDEEPERFARHMTAPDVSAESSLAREQLKQRVRDCLPRLPERDATILSLYYNEEFTYAEIGNLLGVSVSRVCQLHSRALTRLRAEIEADA